MLHRAYCGLSLIAIGFTGTIGQGQTINSDHSPDSFRPDILHAGKDSTRGSSELPVEGGVRTTLPEVDETLAMPVALESPLHVAGKSPGAVVTWLSLDSHGYRALRSAEQVILKDFVLDADCRVDLELRRMTVFADDARIVLGTPAGNVTAPRPDVAVFRGRVVGDSQSRVFLGLSPHGANGFIEYAGERYVVSSTREVGQGRAVVYNLTRLPPGAIHWRQFDCPVCDSVGHSTDPRSRYDRSGDVDTMLRESAGTKTHIEGQRRRQGIVDGQSWSSTGSASRLIQIAIETDWELTALFDGDTDAAGAYIGTLVGAASEIYTRDVDTELQISFLRLWATSDDVWDDDLDIYELWFVYREYWDANMTDVERDVGHLVSGREPFFGLGDFRALCLDIGGYGISGVHGYFPYPLEDHHEQNVDPYVFAHELGHNFGAVHTFETEPPIDLCVSGDCSVAPNGTIMSNCFRCPGGFTNIVLQFHPRMIDEYMLPYLVYQSQCPFSVPEPTIVRHPVDDSVCVGSALTLRVDPGGAFPLQFQWRKDGEDIPGATESELVIIPATAADEGDYDVLVSNDYGSVVSDPASVTIFECGPPMILYAGCRQFTLTFEIPPSVSTPVALLLSSLAFPCLPKYVSADGTLVDAPEFHVADAWGVITLGAPGLVGPSTEYELQTDTGISGQPYLSEPVVFTTAVWGDVVGEFAGASWTSPNGRVDFIDILSIVEGFKNVPTAPPLGWIDLYPWEVDELIDFNDIVCDVDAFRGYAYPYPAPDPCP